MEQLVQERIEQRDRVAKATFELPDIQVSDRMKDISVLGLVADRSACGYYRIINPLHMLKMHGAKVNYASSHSLESFITHDVIVAPRQHSEEVYETYRFSGWENRLLIYEIDDDLDSVLPSSPAYITYHPGSPELKMISKFMKHSHGITTTTPEIARWYYQYNRNVSVVENYIDLSFRNWGADVTWDVDGLPIIRPNPISKPREWEGKTVIMYQGGTTHQEDMIQLGTELKKILEENDNVLFAMYVAVEMYAEFVNRFKLPEDKVVHVKATHFLEHPGGLHGADIQLAPIVACQFNMAKSHLKVLEGMAVGSAVVASHVGPYAKFVRRHPGSFLTVGTGAGCFRTWYEALTYLIKNPDELKRMQIAGRQLIYSQYCLEKNFQKWPQAWIAIKDRVDIGEVGPPDLSHPKDWYKSYGRAGRNDPCPCGSGEKYKVCCDGAFG